MEKKEKEGVLKMKTLDQLKDKYIGNIGSSNRDDYEMEFNKELKEITDNSDKKEPEIIK